MIIIDTDPGGDDALALILALKDKSLNILAITTSYGNADINQTTANAQYVLQKMCTTNIPIYSGAKKPLSREHLNNYFWGHLGLGGILQVENAPLSSNAIQKILDLVDTHKNITILALGPLTNIAQAIITDKKTMLLVHEIVLFGGTITGPGNIRPNAEFNIFLDPEAADIVLHSGIPIKVVTLDAAAELNYTWQDFIETAPDPIKNFTDKLLDTPNRQKMLSEYLCDPLVVYAATNHLSTHKYDIQVCTESDENLGKTLMSPEISCNKKCKIQVVSKINRELFQEYLNKVLCKN